MWRTSPIVVGDPDIETFPTLIADGAGPRFFSPLAPHTAVLDRPDREPARTGAGWTACGAGRRGAGLVARHLRQAGMNLAINMT